MQVLARSSRSWAVFLSALAVGCGATLGTDDPSDSGVSRDAGDTLDTGLPDAGLLDAGVDPDTGARDAGAPLDAGPAGDCPASSVVELNAWDGTPWVAPSMGTAQERFRLPAERDLHYSLLELDFDFTTTTLEGEYNCFAELRNTGACCDSPYPWRYFAICSQNDPRRRTVFIVFASDEGRIVDNFAIRPMTSYHASMRFDAAASEATLTINEIGGPSATLIKTPLTSSIAMRGGGLDLLMGFSVTHPDYPVITPPWGWIFSNLELRMYPGGPHGSAAPPCP